MVDLRNVSLAYDTIGPLSDAPSEPAFAGASESQLRNINIHFKKGECVLITGPSGCGKTSLLRLINGLIPRYYPAKIEGEILLNGQNFAERELYELAPYVGTVFQNPRSQFFNVDTTGELAFYSENQGLEASEILRRIARTAKRLSLEALLERNIFRLSGGEKQQIACGSIDVGGPPLILLDEPSANLDFPAVLRLREIIKIWKDEGKTILIAEHRPSYVWDLLDRLMIMRDGRIISDYPDRSHLNLSQEALRTLGLRSKILENPSDVELPESLPGDRPVIFGNYHFRYKKSLFGKSASEAAEFSLPRFAFAENKITALTGANGSGKSTLLRCLCGLEKHAEGRLFYRGKVYKNRARKDLCFLVMQESSHQLFTESVIEEVLLSLPPSAQSSEERQQAALSILKKLNLDTLKDRHPMTLSGGQKQRLAVASALASDRQILLFDEPTSGLDYKHMLETAKLFQELKAEGKTIIAATHDAELIRAACERKIDLNECEAQPSRASGLNY